MKTNGLRLSTRLGIGAALIGAIAVLACVIMLVGMSMTANRIAISLKAEQRLEHYSALGSQLTSLALVAFAKPQRSDLSSSREIQITRMQENIRATFKALERALEENVVTARGFDERTRRATGSLNLARMRAVFEAFARDLNAPGNSGPSVALQARANVFSTTFQPLLGAAVTEEQLLRDRAFAEIDTIRNWLERAAVALTVLTGISLIVFLLRVVRPQFARLERLVEAARMIKEENFEVLLPDTRKDEIGQVFAEVNAMATRLGERDAEIRQDRAALNQTIEERTEELQSANEALARIDRNRRRFFADISHEMRTPLTVIMMEAELGEAAKEQSAEPFRVIRARAGQLSRRVDDLLRISKSETGELSIRRAEFSLGDAVELAIEDAKRLCERAGIKIAFESRTSPRINGDENWVRQVISGLIDNTVRHGGANTRNIDISMDTRGGNAILVVRDDGVGIPPELQERVFARFGQGDSPERSEGFGIGLGLAAWVIEEHGGRIDLTSPPPGGDGTTGTLVTVSLPCVEG